MPGPAHVDAASVDSVPHAAVVGKIGIQLAAASIPFVSNLIGNAALPTELWAVVLLGALSAWGLAELVSPLVWRVQGMKAA